MDNDPREWAADVLADSDAALAQLCAAVRQEGAEPGVPTAVGPGRYPTLGALPKIPILDALSALAVAVVGATDLANARTHAIVGTLDGAEADDNGPDAGMLVRRGADAIRRIIGSPGT